MKKYFKLLPLFLAIGLMMQSCKEEFNIPTTEETTPAVKKAARVNQNSYAQLLDDLDNLDLSYGFSSVSTISAYEDWDFTDVGGSWSVVAADAEGACHGADIGERIGGTWGAVIGAVVVGSVSSVAEFIKEKNDNDHDNMQIAINPTRPFAYDQYENRFYYGGWAPIGSEIGDLHNSMVSELLAEIDSSNCISTLSDIFEYAYSTNFSTLSTLSTHYTPQQILGVQAYLNTYETDILSDLEDDEMTTLWQDYPDEMEVIKHYAFVLTQTTTFFDRFQYTMDFMTNVHLAYQSELISEESALMINGTISTFYCSKTAWNYIQPDPFFANEFIICGNNTWYLTDSQSQLQLLLGSNPDINFIGYPYISNDTIRRIYVYADSPLNATLQNNNTFISLFNNTTFTNAITTVSVIDNYRNCASIATGNYPIYPAAGYEDYVFIDLE